MEKRTKYITVILVILASLIILPKIKILLEGEKGRIKRIIYAAEAATEKEDFFKCISFISKDYADKYGNDFRSLMVICQKMFDIYDNIAIGIQQLKISLDSDTATAEVESTAVAKNVKNKETNIFEKETIKFLIFFRKEKEGWKVVEIEFLEPKDPIPAGII